MGKALVATLAVLTAAALWAVLRSESHVVDAPTAIEARASRDSVPDSVDPATARAARRDAQPVALPGAPAGLASVEPARWAAGLEALHVSGRVLDEAGRPVPRADVFLLPDPRARERLGISLRGPWGKPDRVSLRRERLESTRSDAGGRFELEAPWFPDGGSRPGRDARVFPTLLVVAPGFAAHGFPCLGYAGGEFDAGDLVLREPGAELVVQLVDPDGAPIAGVELVGRDGAEPDPSLPHLPPQGEPAFQLRSDADGRVRARDLRAGEQRFSFTHRDFETRRERVRLEARASHDLGTLVLEPLGRVHGRVLDAQGRPVPGAEVSTRDTRFEHIDEWTQDLRRRGGGDDGMSGIVVTDEHGAFSLGGLERERSRGRARIVAWAPGVGLSPPIDAPLDSGGHVLRLEPEAHLRVRAVDERDGRAVDGVELLVEVRREPVSAGRSDALAVYRDPVVEGAEIHGVGPAGTQLLVSAPGFQQRWFDAPGVEPGERAEVVVPLRPARMRAVHVVDEVGVPVSGAQLDLHLRWQAYAHGPAHTAHVEAVTDAHGVASLSGLADGKWQLSVSAPGHSMLRMRDLELPDDGAPWRVELQRLAELQGRVLRASGEPAVGLHVAWDPERGSNDDQVTDLHGRFRFEVAPGDGVLRVACTSPRPLELRAGEPQHVEVVQLEPYVLTGVVVAGGSALRDAAVGLGDVERLRTYGGTGTWIRTDADGRFRFVVEHLGTHRLLAAVGGELREEEVQPRFGEHDELLIDFGSTALAGYVEAGDSGVALGGLRITLRDVERERDAARNGFPPPPAPTHAVAPDGGFRFDPIPPGRYELFLAGRGCAGERWGPYEVAAGAPLESLSLRPELGAALAGHALNADGSPFRGSVHLLDDDGTRVASATPAFADGRFGFDALRAGSWRLELTATDGDVALAARDVTLTLAESREVVLRVGESAPR